MVLGQSIIEWNAVKHFPIGHHDTQKSIDFGVIKLFFSHTPKVEMYDDGASGIMRFFIAIPTIEMTKKILLIKQLNEIKTRWYSCSVKEVKDGMVLKIEYNPAQVYIMYDGITDERDMSKCMTIYFFNKLLLLELQNKDTSFLEVAMNRLMVDLNV